MTSLPTNCSCLLPVLGGAFDPWNALPWDVPNSSIGGALGTRLQPQARTTPIDWQGLATTRDSLVASIAAISAVAVVAQVLIRQLDERVVAILREQARARGVSLEQSLREMLTQAAQQHSDVRQRLAVLRRQTPARAQELDVAALIREGREQR